MNDSIVLFPLPCKDCISLAICITTYKIEKESDTMATLIGYILAEKCKLMEKWLNDIDKLEDANYMCNVLIFKKYFHNRINGYLKMTNKLPCINCITLSICVSFYQKQVVLRKYFYMEKQLKKKCSLFEQWLEDSIFKNKRIYKYESFHDFFRDQIEQREVNKLKYNE